ncbi:MAG: hypothetical protein ACYDAE_21335 [Steroidobacteraceae bacterium]
MPPKTPTTSANGAFPEDSFKYSPLEHVRTLFVRFVQGLFNAAPPGAYHWEPNDEQTEIYVSDENALKAETIGQRPAVTCTRGPIQFYTLGLDDMLSYDIETGTKRKSVLVPGTMVINCCSRAALESERIAWICAEQLWLHREMLMQAGFFEIGRQPAIGSPSPAGSLIVADSGDEWYLTAVTCPFQFYRTSQFSPLGKRIVKEISVSIRERMALVHPQQGPVSSPAPGSPYLVRGHFPPAYAPAASDVYGGTPEPGSTAPVLKTVPHPLNPAQRVTIRASRPNSPGLKPPGMGGRPIPIAQPAVKESCGNQMDSHVAKVKV